MDFEDEEGEDNEENEVEKHKRELEELKKTDPEFIKYLEKEDKQVLNFGEDVSASIFFSSSSTFPYELFFFSVCVCMENR
jgi:nucleolar complex protein 2